MEATALRRPRRRFAASERRGQIIAAAKEIFLREGVERASMRNIAARVGVTPTLIYQHFADKDALLSAICEEFFSTLTTYVRAAADGQTDPLARLKLYMKAYVRCGLDHPREYQLTFMSGLPHLSRGEMKGRMRRLRESLSVTGEMLDPDEVSNGMRCFAMLEMAVREVIKTLDTRFDDPAIVAEIIWSSGHGLVALMVTHEDFGWSDREGLIETSVDLLMHGLLKKEA